MTKEETGIEGLMIITPQVFGDDRGFFYESYNADKMAALGITDTWNQDSHSASAKGVLRGLHFQLPPKAQAKLVRCTKGRVWDVVVDLRKESKTYLQWFGVELSAENKKMLYVPAGFGHGFHALEDCEFVYKVSQTFDPELDGNVRYNDPAFEGIDWKLEGEPVLSARDAAAPAFAELDLPF
jgi:dTDP-4-dehydrorhamnose 3,5-epimerase